MITYSFTLELPCLRVTWVTDSETEVCMLEFCQGGCSEGCLSGGEGSRTGQRESLVSDEAAMEALAHVMGNSQVKQPFRVVPNRGKGAESLQPCMNGSLDGCWYHLGQGSFLWPKAIIAEGLSYEWSVANTPDSLGTECLGPEVQERMSGIPQHPPTVAMHLSTTVLLLDV